MPILAWIKSKRSLLKIMEGSGDNLDRDDIADGLSSYVLFSEFKFGDLDIDGELEIGRSNDGGMLMFHAEEPPMDVALRECYEDVCGRPFDKDDVVVLVDDRADGRA